MTALPGVLGHAARALCALAIVACAPTQVPADAGRDACAVAAKDGSQCFIDEDCVPQCDAHGAALARLHDGGTVTVVDPYCAGDLCFCGYQVGDACLWFPPALETSCPPARADADERYGSSTREDLCAADAGPASSDAGI